MKVLGEIRIALRNLRGAPGAALAVTLTVAIGIAATATIFAVVDALYLRPLPGIERPSELVNVHAKDPDGTSFHSLSYRTWRALSEAGGPFTGIAAFSSRLLSLSVQGDPRLAVGQLVTGNYFGVVGARPALGRLFGPETDSGASPDVAVLSDSVWRGRFGADPSIVGRSVLVNGRAFTVVGVAEPRFSGTFLGTPFDVWVPVTARRILAPGEEFDPQDQTWLELVARRRPGVTLESASNALAVVARRLDRERPAGSPPFAFDLHRTTGFEDSLEGPATAFFAILSALALLVLGIACANVTGIRLARGFAREKEIGVRVALGAARSGLVRLLLVENLLQFLAGGALGVAVTAFTAPLLERFNLPTPVPILFHFAPGLRVAAFGLLAAAAAGLLFGAFPAWLATRPDLLPLLRAGATTERRATSRMRGVFVGAQVAFSVLLLVIAGLFQQTLRHAAAAHPGFDREGLAVMQVDLSLLGYDPPRARAAFDRLAERVRSLPGVESAAVSSSLPLGLGHRTATVGLPGSAVEARVSAETAEVDDGYFSTMRIPLLHGRAFGGQDVAGAPNVAVVNETLSRRLWPGVDPIGRTIAGERGAISVVGVVRDGKYRQLWESPRPFLYLASRQSQRLRRDLVVRSASPPEALAAGIRRELRAIDPAIPFSEIMSIERFIGFSTLPQRAAGAISGALGGLGLLVTAIGLAGLVAYSVSRRTREIGLRLAIGAMPRDVLLLEIRRAAVVAALGFAPGAAAAALLTPLLRRFLFGVGVADPVTFAAVAVLLGGTTFVASWLPARRAARLDPLAALRMDG